MLQELSSIDHFNTRFKQGEKFVVLKHSTRCNVSASAYATVKRFSEENNIPIDLVYVVENRPLSNEIESITGIRHESPQLLIFENGKVSAHTSHFKIDAHFLNTNITR
jgi:bacillithiol system protein YtxJ